MSTVKQYVDFLKKRSRDSPSDERPFQFSVWPSWLGKAPETCTVFMSFADCAQALELRFDLAPLSKKEEAAEEQINFLRDNFDEEGAEFLLFAAVAGRKPKELRRTYARAAQTHTLFFEDGSKAHGTAQQLVAHTGLERRRVGDLLSGRRTYARGWALSPERAAEGPRRQGRRRTVS